MLKLPLPSPGKEFDEILRKGFERYEERKINYDKYIESTKSLRADQPVSVNYKPVKIDIELMNRCNLKCDMCYIPYQKRDLFRLKFDAVKEVFDEMNTFVEARIQGIGEPLLCSDDLVKCIKYASDKYIWTRTTTNGMLMHKNDNYKRIIDAGIGELGISIDGASKDVYEAIRKGADFSQLCRNMEQLHKYCDDNSLLKTRMWVVAQQLNYDELIDFPKFAKNIGFKRVTLSLAVVDWGVDQMKDKNAEKMIAPAQEFIDEIIREGEKEGVEMTFWDHAGKYNAEKVCDWPFGRLFISSNGDVVPCCVIPNPDIFNLGNIHKNSLSEIWFSNRYKAFRDEQLSLEISELCAACYDKDCIRKGK